MKMPENMVPTSLWHLLYIYDHLLLDEVKQIEALSGEFDPETCAASTFLQSRGAPCFTLLTDAKQPLIAGGYIWKADGIWASWMIGTELAWKEHGRAGTRCARWVMEQMFEAGARRLETTCLVSREQTIQWYERSLGLIREGTWHNYGKNGEDVAMFAAVRR